MDWHLLNQHCVNLDSENFEISVLEEVVSSEQQLVQVLVSGVISSKTMTSLLHSQEWCNQILLENQEYLM